MHYSNSLYFIHSIKGEIIFLRHHMYHALLPNYPSLLSYSVVGQQLLEGGQIIAGNFLPRRPQYVYFISSHLFQNINLSSIPTRINCSLARIPYMHLARYLIFNMSCRLYCNVRLIQSSPQLIPN